MELDVDVISDGLEWSVPGILEQRDPPGVHSGDSLAVLPPRVVSRAAQERAAEAAGRIALALGVRGILNVQAIVSGERVVVIEANPRASRTVPIVAKATGTSNPHNMVQATFEALKNMQSPRQIATRRGKKVSDIVSGRQGQGKEEDSDD